MPSVLSVVSVVAVLSVAAFVFVFVITPSNESTRLASTEKRYKAAVPRWNKFAIKEGITIGEENVPSLVDAEGKTSKEGNRLVQHFAVFLDTMPDMTYNAWIVCFNWVQLKLKIQTATHDLTDPKGHIRGLPTVQKLNKKWFASQNGITLVRNNEVKHNNIHAQIKKEHDEGSDHYGIRSLFKR